MKPILFCIICFSFAMTLHAVIDIKMKQDLQQIEYNKHRFDRKSYVM